MRIPVDFHLHCERLSCNLARGDTAAFWFGALLVAGSIWGLWLYRQNFGFKLVAYALFLVVGGYMMGCGAFGIRPFAWLS